VKSHGSANVKGVAHAITVAARLVEEALIERITSDLGRLGEWGTPRRAVVPNPVDVGLAGGVS
jgi:glycerol-3-phosphate acyltransferase PlsX